MSTRHIPASVVVALISGDLDDLRRCLTALRTQQDAPAFEIIVPFDEPCRGVLTLANEFPDVQFLPLTGVDTRAARGGASREHHDLLRTLGLSHASGEIVVLTEDHAHADPRWLVELLQTLAAHPAAAGAGGSVEWGGRDLLSYAVYLCDFGRYQNPLPEAPAHFVSDSNVAYRSEVLNDLADAWRNGYTEAALHGSIVTSGRELWLTPKSVVWQERTGLTWGFALRERFVWGRSYASTRVRSTPLGRRLAYAAFCPALPLLLTWRLVSGLRKKNRLTSRAILLVPALFLLSTAWAAGEGTGYLASAAS
jgi:hypothetical protein